MSKPYKTDEEMYGKLPITKLTFNKSNNTDQLLLIYPSLSELLIYKCIITLINNTEYNNVVHIFDGDGLYAKTMRIMNIYKPSWKYIVIDPSTCSKFSKNIKEMSEFCNNKISNVNIVSKRDDKVDYKSIFPETAPDLFICTAISSHGNINVIYKAMKKIYGENIKYIFMTINCVRQELDIKPNIKFASSYNNVYCWTNLST